MNNRGRATTANDRRAIVVLLAAASMCSPAAGFDAARLREEVRIGMDSSDELPRALLALPSSGHSTLAVLSSHTVVARGFDAASRRLVPLWFTDRQHSNDWKFLVAGDLDGDGAQDLLAANAAGELTLLDPGDGTIRGLETLDVGQILAIVAADVDPLPGDELVLLTPNGIEIRRFRFAPLLWSHTAVAGGTDIAVGNIDADPGLEVVVSFGTGFSGVAIDTLLRRTEWAYGPGFGDEVAIAELDGVPPAEILAWERGYGLRAIDGVRRVPIWSGGQPLGRGIRTHDFDGDGAAEILLRGDKAIDLVSLRAGGIWRSVAWPGAAYTDHVVPAELDGDCEPEFAIAGWPYNALQTIGLDGSPETLLEYQDGASAHALWAGDLEGDSRPELVRMVRNSTGDLWLERIAPGAPPMPRRRIDIRQGRVRGLAAGQLDLDPELEYVVAGTITPGVPVLLARDGLDDSRAWISTPLSEEVAALVAGDLDGDGIDEVVAGTVSSLWLGGQGFVHVFAGADGAPLWRGPNASSDGGVWDLRIGDVTGDGQPEIVSAVNGSGVHAHDGKSFALATHIPLTGIMALDIADWDSDGDVDVFTGETSGLVQVFDVASRASLATFDLSPGSIRALRVRDVDGDGSAEIVIGQSLAPESSSLRILRASDGRTLWEDPAVHGDVGLGGGIHAGELDGDPRRELAVSTDLAVRVYEYDDRRVDSSPPSWPQDPGLRLVAVSSAASCCAHVELAWDPAGDAGSPWLRYRIHRGSQAGFVPGPATLVGETPQLSWWDRGAPTAATSYYLVRAVDGAGNEDGNLVELSVDPSAPDLPPPDQGNVLRLAPGPVSTTLDWRDAGATLWRVERAEDRRFALSALLIARTAARSGADAAWPARGLVAYYRVRGLSPCSHTPGP